MNCFYKRRSQLFPVVLLIISLIFILKGVAYLLAGRTVYSNHRGDSVVTLTLILIDLLILYCAVRLWPRQINHHSKRHKNSK